MYKSFHIATMDETVLIYSSDSDQEALIKSPEKQHILVRTSWHRHDKLFSKAVAGMIPD